MITVTGPVWAFVAVIAAFTVGVLHAAVVVRRWNRNWRRNRAAQRRRQAAWDKTLDVLFGRPPVDVSINQDADAKAIADRVIEQIRRRKARGGIVTGTDLVLIGERACAWFPEEVIPHDVDPASTRTHFARSSERLKLAHEHLSAAQRSFAFWNRQMRPERRKTAAS